MQNLDKIMKPRAIAVIGASTKAHTIGSDIMKRLQEYGVKGKIYPVNPKGGIIEGLQAYPSVLDVPGEVDLAIVVVNAKFVLSTIDQCHEKGVGGLCVISAGFKETGKEGAALEQALLKKVRDYGMRCVGPNCLGVVNTHPDIRMDGCFAESLPERGGIGFVSQSGALGGGILNILKDLNLGFAQFISIGNQADVNAETAIEYWENEDDVKQILLYMESIQNPSNFRELASRVSKKKPILALKAGRSAAGASAASSHTGSLAGADKAANALLTQSGVIREYSLENLFATAKVFANCPIPQGVIENYFEHGYDSAIAGENFIHIRGRLADGGLILFEVEDNGLGIPPDRMAQMNQQLQAPIRTAQESYGLKNLYQRLRLFYGEPCGLTLCPRAEGRGLRIEVRVKQMKCEDADAQPGQT